MFERILLAVDASDCSRRAVTTAAELAGKVGAEVIVLHVFEVAPVPLGVGVEPMVIMPEAKDVAHELVAEAVAELRRAGVTARGEVSDTKGDDGPADRRWRQVVGRGPGRDGLARPVGPRRPAAGQHRSQGDPPGGVPRPGGAVKGSELSFRLDGGGLGWGWLPRRSRLDPPTQPPPARGEETQLRCVGRLCRAG